VIYLRTWIHKCDARDIYAVATISRLLKITGLFCRTSSLLQGSFAKETYDFKEPTSRSQPIPTLICTNKIGHVWMPREHINESRRHIPLTHAWVMSRPMISRLHYESLLQKSPIKVIRETWLIHTTDSFIRVTWPMHMCDMTPLYVWHDSFIRVTWPLDYIF